MTVNVLFNQTFFIIFLILMTLLTILVILVRILDVIFVWRKAIFLVFIMSFSIGWVNFV